MNLSPEVQKAAAWLQAQVVENPYSEIGIKLILHAGKISRYEQSVSVKLKPETGAQNEKQHRYQ